MNKIKDITIWVFFQLIAIILLYLAGIKSIKGAENVLKFIIAINCVFSILILILITKKDEKVISALANKYRIPCAIDMIYSLLFACALAWFGYIALAIIDFIAGLMQIGITKEIKEINKENNIKEEK